MAYSYYPLIPACIEYYTCRFENLKFSMEKELMEHVLKGRATRRDQTMLHVSVAVCLIYIYMNCVDCDEI
jgi:hypothetical protein